MKHRIGMAFALALASGAALAQAPAGDVARGKAAFLKQGCAACHGTIGHGGDRGSGPRIAFEGLWPYAAFAQQTRRPRGVMPRYPADHLPDQELADIYAYIASQKPGPKASDITLLKE
jgi:mono/diheme cytochrome c family protein